jgi:hypothetical protein
MTSNAGGIGLSHIKLYIITQIMHLDHRRLIRRQY